MEQFPAHHRQFFCFDYFEIVFQCGKFQRITFCGNEQSAQLFLVDSFAMISDSKEKTLMFIAVFQQMFDSGEQLFPVPAVGGRIFAEHPERDHFGCYVVTFPAELVRHLFCGPVRAHPHVAAEAACRQKLRQAAVLAERIDAVRDRNLLPNLRRKYSLPNLDCRSCAAGVITVSDCSSLPPTASPRPASISDAMVRNNSGSHPSSQR